MGKEMPKNFAYNIPQLPYKEIKARIILAGLKITELAKELGVSQCHVTLVLQGKAQSARVLGHVLKRIGLAR